MLTYLQDASDAGAKIMPNTRADRILTEDGRARRHPGVLRPSDVQRATGQRPVDLGGRHLRRTGRHTRGLDHRRQWHADVLGSQPDDHGDGPGAPQCDQHAGEASGFRLVAAAEHSPGARRPQRPRDEHRLKEQAHQPGPVAVEAEGIPVSEPLGDVAGEYRDEERREQ